MAEFIEAGGIEQVPVGTGTTFTVAEKPIAVFNVDGTLYAIADGCLHRGSSVPPARCSVFDGRFA
jgi:nitrite reductase/ring-hydroxylating ferredoxin subunit